jgi:hypothetical protein
MYIIRTDPASGGNYGRKASPVYQLNYQGSQDFGTVWKIEYPVSGNCGDQQ